MTDNGTTFQFTADASGTAGGALIIPLLTKPEPPMEVVSRADAQCDRAASRLIAAKALREDVGLIAHSVADNRGTRVVLVSLGDAKKVAAADIRTAAGAAARWMIAERQTQATVWIEGLAGTGVEHALAEWAQGMALAGFRFAAYKKREEKTPTRIRIALAGGQRGHIERKMAAVRTALIVADGANYTRRLAHEPPNALNPRTLADEARRLARAAKLRCTILDAAALRRMSMGGLLAVGGGAQHPPCLIQLEYRGAPKARRVTALVGKSITFDTGGYSIKPAEGMEAMKMDMTGGATVLGALKAAAALKLTCNLVGILAVAENAVSALSYRPGDILRMASGKTVEVTNTDAEGRLVLADALWYAQEKTRATEVIDLATLTGGVRIALGSAAAGLMSNDDQLAGDLGEAGRRTHERLWRLPLWNDYRELIKSTEADIKNSSGKRDAAAIVGGMFLKEFVKDETPWAHLDIAAVVSSDQQNGPAGKGATGFGVRLLIEFLRIRGA
jgi:leucyl aminopeptidase